MMETAIDGEVSDVGPSPTSGSNTPTATELPAKDKGRRRLLRGLQRISSYPSLNSLLSSRSNSNNPYRTRNTLSCASLAAVSPPQASSSGTSSTPQPSPLGFPSAPAASAPISSQEFPFYDKFEESIAVRKVDSIHQKGATATSALPPALRPAKQDGQNKTLAVPKTLAKNPFQFWANMPRELRVRILSFLRPKELVRASRVSRRFHRLCFDGQLWTSIDASEFYRQIPAESLSRIIVSAGPFIKNLNLRGCVQVEHYKRTEVIVKACKNLMAATLEGCPNFHNNTLHSLLRTNEKLMYLNLTGLTSVSNTTCRIVAESCPQLESFNVSWCDKVEAQGLKVVIESCPKLRDLRAGEVRGFDDLETARAIFRTNKLERLVLCGCSELTDDALEVMMRGVNPKIDILTNRPLVRPRKLRHLDLSRCGRLSSSGVQAIGYVVPDLQGLQLSGCKSLTDEALEPILASTPRLTHLELEDLENLTSASMKDLAKAPCAETLEHLSISYCEKITDSGMLPVLRKCVALKSVDMDNTQISDFSLIEAAAAIVRRSKRSFDFKTRPKESLRLVVYDCQNVTWTGIREVLFRNAQIRASVTQPGKVTYPTEVIGLKCFHGFQMTVDEHQKRVLRGDLASASRLERKWAVYMQANEEAGTEGAGSRRRRRRAREAYALHAVDVNEEEGGLIGRQRARTVGACSVM